MAKSIKTNGSTSKRSPPCDTVSITISALEAKLKAESEYEQYRITQDKLYVSDFDREIKKFLDENNCL